MASLPEAHTGSHDGVDVLGDHIEETREVGEQWNSRAALQWAVGLLLYTTALQGVVGSGSSSVHCRTAGGRGQWMWCGVVWCGVQLQQEYTHHAPSTYCTHYTAGVMPCRAVRHARHCTLHHCTLQAIPHTHYTHTSHTPAQIYTHGTLNTPLHALMLHILHAARSTHTSHSQCILRFAPHTTQAMYATTICAIFPCSTHFPLSQANFSLVLTSPTAGLYIAQFTSPGLSAATVTVYISVGSPHGLSIATQPSENAHSDKPLTTQPVLLLIDVGGNTVESVPTQDVVFVQVWGLRAVCVLRLRALNPLPPTTSGH